MEEHTITLETVVEATRERVWRAFTEPDELSKWWGPAGFSAPPERIEVDLRAGGAFRLTMVGPDGQEFPNDGHFRIVEPVERLSFGGTLDDNAMMQSAETTVELVALDDDRTRVIVTSRMVCVRELIDMAKAGWSSQLDKLAPLFAI